jgi:hypothetical protein
MLVRMWRNDNLVQCWWEWKVGTTVILQKLKHGITVWPSSSTCGMYPRVFRAVFNK